MKINLRNNLKKIREDKNISQTELSILSGISQNYISEIEAGKKLPSLTILEKIATGLEVCVSLLLTNKECCDCLYKECLKNKKLCHKKNSRK